MVLSGVLHTAMYKCISVSNKKKEKKREKKRKARDGLLNNKKKRVHKKKSLPIKTSVTGVF